jgi:putative membrane protein
MKRFGQCALALLVSTAITACAGDTRRDDATTGATGTTGTAGTSADVDRSWVNKQLVDGDIEVRLGRLAQERGGSADVRAFGAMMVEKHTMAGTELKRIADRHNVAPDADRKDTGKDDFERLSKLSGQEFDKAYLDLMVEEHEEAVNALEGKASDNDEHADVKEWASKTLPEVRNHLDRAKQLRERLDRNGNRDQRR